MYNTTTKTKESSNQSLIFNTTPTATLSKRGQLNRS